MIIKRDMERLFKKLDSIQENITGVKIETEGIKSEFKALNSRVQRHAEEIEKNRFKITQIDRRLAIYTGGIAVIVFITGIAIKFS